MTDSEISKAIAYWKDFDSEIDELLSEHDLSTRDVKTLEKQRAVVRITLDALSLITRQKEEVDRYQSIFGQLVEKDGEVIRTIGEKKQCFIRSDIANLMTRAAVKTAEAEIEQLKEANNQFADFGKMCSEIKSEARREFAERLKAYLLLPTVKEMSVVTANDIDNLLKEMESEKNDCI